jgi:uncharacterized membrane protein YdjX (TVP38/TMEM64 family)
MTVRGLITAGASCIAQPGKSKTNAPIQAAMDLERPAPRDTGLTMGARARRFVPLGLVALGMLAVFATGAYRHVSLETLVRHRMAIDGFITEHSVAAIAAFMAAYIVVVALSIPGAIVLTISSGILFGTLVGGTVAVISSSIGATIIFLVARSACGESLIRRAGPLAGKLAAGFRADAFSYLLFLRLVPAFPFFLVNLAPALVGVKLSTFVSATLIGVIPATFAFAFFGSGLDSVIAAQEKVFRACLSGGRSDCHLQFDLGMIATPQLLGALATLGVIALIPIAIKRLRARPARSRPAPLV